MAGRGGGSGGRGGGGSRAPLCMIRDWRQAKLVCLSQTEVQSLKKLHKSQPTAKAAKPVKTQQAAATPQHAFGKAMRNGHDYDHDADEDAIFGPPSAISSGACPHPSDTPHTRVHARADMCGGGMGSFMSAHIDTKKFREFICVADQHYLCVKAMLAYNHFGRVVLTRSSVGIRYC